MSDGSYLLIKENYHKLRGGASTCVAISDQAANEIRSHIINVDGGHDKVWVRCRIKFES